MSEVPRFHPGSPTAEHELVHSDVNNFKGDPLSTSEDLLREAEKPFGGFNHTQMKYRLKCPDVWKILV